MMARWNQNGEGYADSTAGIAIQKVSREERKIAMGKKRSCRRTTDENIIHEKAVKMRKMLTVGDKVVMNNQYHVPEHYKGKEFIVTAGPQEVGGIMCVWLEGYRGCYAEDGLSKVGGMNV